ncbi:class A beta-lactamase [Piscinibacter koreensis]|uniref:Beta-lactamase n=1 Tax=Piscinibacter koreensis TaxID=2742824 RepID=A0A7Y6NS32_9BURK|nr:class A beta-lactamase [Schlegelella koreensis]NUZ08291.1 class A beta-lactamase [Schlegelella koreensis]
MLSRRTCLAALPSLASWPAWAAVASELEAYERTTGGRVGMHAENLASGATLAWRADQRFLMCSTFKASLAALVLQRVDAKRMTLEQTIRYGAADLHEHAPLARENLAKGALSIAELCRGAVELSDNTCANLLLARVGGPPALTAFWRAIGDTVSRLDDGEPLLNRTPPGRPENTTTPAAMATTLRRMVLGDVLAPPSRERLTQWMLNCRTGANRLRAGLPPGWPIANRTGSNGKDASGDIAVIWPASGGPLVVSVYTRAGAPTAAQLEALYTGVARLVASQLV